MTGGFHCSTAWVLQPYHNTMPTSYTMTVSLAHTELLSKNVVSNRKIDDLIVETEEKTGKLQKSGQSHMPSTDDGEKLR